MLQDKLIAHLKLFCNDPPVMRSPRLNMINPTTKAPESMGGIVGLCMPTFLPPDRQVMLYCIHWD